MNSLAKMLLNAILIACIAAAEPTAAAYVKSDKIISVSTDTGWLYDAASDGVKAGVKTVTKDILSNVGNAVVRLYAPEIADLLFGRRSDLEQYTQRIIDEFQASHSDLARRHRDLLDEIMDQFSVDVIGRFRAASDLLNSWLATEDLLERADSMNVVLDVMKELNEVRTIVEEYIKSSASPSIQYRRLQLSHIHITVAQLAVTSSRHYWGTISIRSAFRRSPFGSDDSRFDEWIESLSEIDFASIRTMNPQFNTFRRNVYEQVLDFYAAVAEEDSVADYMGDIFTPPVSQMERFQPNPSLYDNPDVVTDDDSWAAPAGGPFVRLDGLRWYYYVNIPRSTCLEGWAFDALRDRDTFPWTEVHGEPAASECNRFWILEPDLVSSAWPDTNLGSFDAYSLWFEDGGKLYGLHKQFIHGDLVRAIYGPISLVLDRMYQEVRGSTRPENRWDRLLGVTGRPREF